MKTLHLLRHAKSSWKKRHLNDASRPLNGRGKRVLPLMVHAGVLDHEHAFEIYSSTARRAVETIEGLVEIRGNGNKIHYDDQLYTFSAHNLLRWIRSIHTDSSAVMIVGHNPAIIELVTMLTGERMQRYPTCAYTEIKLNIENWSEIDVDCGKLASFLKPAWVSYEEYSRKLPDDNESPDFASSYIQHIKELTAPAILGFDAEFLHKARVNCRKLLAYCEVYGHVFDGAVDIEPVKMLAKAYIRNSNEVRDLDVLLCHLRSWQQSRSEITDADLEQLLSIIKENNKQPVHRFKAFTESDDFNLVLKQAEKICDEMDSVVGQKTYQPVENFNGVDVDDLMQEVKLISEDKLLHKFRARIKKYRYMLRLIHPERRLLEQLTGFQDLLGQYNDSVVELGLIKKQLDIIDGPVKSICDKYIEYSEHQKRLAKQKMCALSELTLSA